MTEIESMLEEAEIEENEALIRVLRERL